MGEIEVKLVRLCINHGPTTNYDANFNCVECGEHTKEEVISGDMAITTQGGIMAESPAVPARKKRMCTQFGKEIAEDARNCPYCGVSLIGGTVNEGTATGVAAAGGIIGINGLGHLIQGELVKGFILLFGGIILITGIVISIFMAVDLMDDVYTFLAVILGVIYVALFVFQVIDANASARRHNLSYENHRLS